MLMRIIAGARERHLRDHISDSRPGTIFMESELPTGHFNHFGSWGDRRPPRVSGRRVCLITE